jgi:signal transduction histidine kinase/CheY-like chemotaxis protein
MITEYGSFTVANLPSVFTVRQLGRDLAADLGLEHQDQVRAATALSEITRSTVTVGLTAVVSFGADNANLVLTIAVPGHPPDEGVSAAGRLMDRVSVEETGDGGTVVTMTKRRPGDIQPDAAAIAAHLTAVLPQSSLDELRRNNQDLISALEDLTAQKEQLLLLNAELAETNRGVVALYKELSDELDQTNQGVVALYAELDQKSEQLREVSQSKDRFWANVSHELRTPLNSILGLTRLLEDPAEDGLGTEQLHQVKLIRNSTTTLLTLVNDLLDVAKAESGRLSIEPANVSLPELLSRLRALTGPLAEGKPVEVIVSDAGAPATVLTDETALTAILRNLLSNGIKYTDTGEVRLSVRSTDTTIDITVADTGAGIPAGQLERVFEEFYQVPGARRGGTGLGLPYARRLAGLLGAGLTLTSEPGAGTTVTLSLPAGLPSVGTVLIADDDAGFRQVLGQLLTGVADHIVETEDGAQALAVIADRSVDLVLTDLRMPGIDGSTLLQRLPDHLPAIVITGLDVQPPPRAAALLRKDEITRERLTFSIRQAMRKLK